MTLPEVLVTMVVLAILLSMIGTILVSSITTQKAVEATLIRERVGSAILDLIARDVAAVNSYGIPSSFKGAAERGGSGSADKMEMITYAQVKPENPDNQSPGGIAQGSALMGEQPPDRREIPQFSKVSYVARESRSHPGLLTLFRSEQKFIRDTTAPPPGGSGQPAPPPRPTPAAEQADMKEHVYEVFDRVRSFGLRYLFKEKDSLEWRDKWDDPEKIPAAVEITLEIVADAREAPDANRRRKIYKTVVGIMVSNPEPQQQQATQPGQPAPPKPPPQP